MLRRSRRLHLTLAVLRFPGSRVGYPQSCYEASGRGGGSGKLVNALTCRAQIYLETGRSGDANPPQRIDCVLGKGPWCHLHAKFTGRMQATAVFPQLVRSPNARKLPCPGETR